MKNKLVLSMIFVFFTFGVLTTIALPADIPRITTEELKAILGNPDLTILDLRLGKAWTESDLKIKGAVREDPENIGSWANQYAKDKTLVLY